MEKFFDASCEFITALTSENQHSTALVEGLKLLLSVAIDRQDQMVIIELQIGLEYAIKALDFHRSAGYLTPHVQELRDLAYKSIDSAKITLLTDCEREKFSSCY